MQTKYKILISIAVVVLVGLTCFLVWWLRFRKSSYKTISNFELPIQRQVNQTIAKNVTTKTSNSKIPKRVRK